MIGVIGSIGNSKSSNGGIADNGASNGSTVSPTEKAEKVDKLELVDGAEGITTTHDAYSLYFEGYIKNNTDKEYNYVSITFNLYDKNDALLGTAIDNVNNLKGGKQWKFKAMAFLTSDQLADVASWEVADVTGW